eukprot:jgi/Ulvmu1/6709/UM030_0042.1
MAHVAWARSKLRLQLNEPVHLVQARQVVPHCGRPASSILLRLHMCTSVIRIDTYGDSSQRLHWRSHIAEPTLRLGPHRRGRIAEATGFVSARQSSCAGAACAALRPCTSSRNGELQRP